MMKNAVNDDTIRTLSVFQYFLELLKKLQLPGASF